MMFLVVASSRMSCPTSQPGTACEIQQLLGSDEEQVPVELGAPGTQAAALGFLRECCFQSLPGCHKSCSQTGILIVLASLLTFGNQILLLKSFLEAEWKTGAGFGGAFLVMVCKIYGFDLKGALA